MRMQSLSRGLLLAAVLVGCLRSSGAQTLRALTPAETEKAISQADKSLLPEKVGDLQFERKQAAMLNGSLSLVLLPVRFSAPNPGGGTAPFFECGLFLLTPGKPGRFLPTFGVDFTETESCLSLQAIGTAAHPPGDGVLPPLALIYSASSLRNSFTEPIVLHPQGSGYTVDAELSQWLGQQKEGHTVGGIRRLIPKHRQGDSAKRAEKSE